VALRARAIPSVLVRGGTMARINLPAKETIEALNALPQISTGVLTLIRYPDGNHQLARPDRSAWFRKRGILLK